MSTRSRRPVSRLLVVPVSAIVAGSLATVPGYAASTQTVPVGQVSPAQLIMAIAAETASDVAVQGKRSPYGQLPAVPESPVTDASPAATIADFQVLLTAAGSEVAATGEWDRATTAAVRLFQSKQGIKKTGRGDARTVDLVAQRAGDGSVPTECTKPGIRLCVDKAQKVVRYFRDGIFVRTININIGPEKGDENYGRYSSTRVGTNKVFYKKVHSYSSLYGYPMPYMVQFDGGIGFHYSDYFAQTGYRDTSMGCTIIADKSEARWLYNNTPKGTKVTVYRGNTGSARD